MESDDGSLVVEVDVSSVNMGLSLFLQGMSAATDVDRQAL